MIIIISIVVIMLRSVFPFADMAPSVGEFSNEQIHVCIPMYTHTYSHTHIYIFISLSLSIHIYIHIHVYIYIYIYMYVYVYVCIHIYVYIIITRRQRSWATNSDLDVYGPVTSISRVNTSLLLSLFLLVLLLLSSLSLL